MNRVQLHHLCRRGSRGEDGGCTERPATHPALLGTPVGVGCSFSNDSHLSKPWMMQPQHSAIPTGGGAVSITAHVI